MPQLGCVSMCPARMFEGPRVVVERVFACLRLCAPPLRRPHLLVPSRAAVSITYHYSMSLLDAAPRQRGGLYWMEMVEGGRWLCEADLEVLVRASWRPRGQRTWRTHDGRRGGEGCYDARRGVLHRDPRASPGPFRVTGMSCNLVTAVRRPPDGTRSDYSRESSCMSGLRYLHCTAPYDPVRLSFSDTSESL
jgi:hypothetical protein